MSTVEAALDAAAQGAAAASMAASLGKRPAEGLLEGGPDAKVMKTDPATYGAGQYVAPPVAPTPTSEEGKKPPMSKAREIRLEQNRKAARESRRRKKTMIEELQRSVIFFSRANSTLKQQNDELSRLLMQSQAQVAAIESGQQPIPGTPAPTSGQAPTPATAKVEGQTPTPAPPAVAAVPAAAPGPPVAQAKTEGGEQTAAFQQAQAQAVATQAVLESQGFPAAAARQAAQTMNAASQPGGAASAPPLTSTPTPAVAAGTAATSSLQQMQPGATMQAMATFQQAAAAAMQAAMAGMQGAGIPGVNMATMAAAPAGTNPQQAYTDTMTAFAMQQAAAAAAAAGQHGFFPGTPFMAPMMWPGQPAPGTMVMPTGAPPQSPLPVPIPAPAPQLAPAAPGQTPVAPAAPAVVGATAAIAPAAPAPATPAHSAPAQAPASTPVAPPVTTPAPTAAPAATTEANPTIAATTT